MKHLAAALASLAVALVLLLPAGAADADKNAGQQLAHDVFFTLKDRTPEAKQKLVDSCKKYLTGHPGCEAFSAGVVAEDLTGPLNDREFDVALHILFKDKAAHDQYVDSERHKKFVAENRDSFAKVRVFDSYVEPTGQRK